MHAKKKIELIIERMAYKRACRLLQAAGMTGYTVLPAIEGFGGGRTWQRDTDISASSDMVIIVSVGNAEKVAAAIEEVERLLGDHIGIVTVSDVSVIRDERF